MRMKLEAFVDLLLEKYCDRSQYPDDEEQLKTLLAVFARTAQALRTKKEALERLSIETAINREVKKKAKK